MVVATTRRPPRAIATDRVGTLTSWFLEGDGCCDQGATTSRLTYSRTPGPNRQRRGVTEPRERALPDPNAALSQQ
jgi:hypothetical protein